MSARTTSARTMRADDETMTGAWSMTGAQITPTTTDNKNEYDDRVHRVTDEGTDGCQRVHGQQVHG
jgi:hypothetical protein